MRETPWSRIMGQKSVDEEFLEIVGNGSPTGSVLEETICSLRHDFNKRGKLTQSNTSPNSFMQENERKASRTRRPRWRSPSRRISRWPCKDYLKGTCTNSFCKKWHLQNACLTRPRVVASLGETCSYAHRQVDEQQTKGPKRMMTKVQWLYYKKRWSARKRTCYWPVSRSIGETWQKEWSKVGTKVV